MPLARADVRDVCFVHWPVDAEELAARLPPALSPATRDGTAWVSVLGQRTLAGLDPLPWRYEYAQLAVRTYVRPGDPEPADRDPKLPDDVGVYFLRVDADSRFASLGARSLYDVPFRHASVFHRRVADGFEVGTGSPGDTGGFVARFEPSGEPVEPEPGSLTAWLTDRYRYYVPDGRAGETDHEPWRLSDASVKIENNGLFDSLDLPEPNGDHVARYSAGADFWLARRP